MRRLAAAALLAATLCSTAEAQEPIDYLHEPAIERDLRMQWWRDARFGMFIHWGLYAVPAGVWKGERIDGVGEWIMSYANIPVAEYEPLADRFNPAAFDAEEWCGIAADAGQEYLIITSKHHDGFAIFDSEVSDYDVVDRTPFGRDILAELADGCRRKGVTLGFYYSILDWHHPAQYVDPDAETPQRGHFMNKIHPDRKAEYLAYMKAQIEELVTRYDPAVLWFDGEWVEWWTEEDGKDMYNYVRSLKPDILINNRVGKGRMGMEGLNRGPGYAGDFGTPEQQIPATGLPGVDWESCMTMNDTWGFKSWDDNWKSAESLIRNLADVASKGGNYLLNVGPTAEGRIPAESIERLSAVGDWMDVNAEAVYLTSASPFEQPAWGRFTRRDPSTLYAHVFELPEGGTVEIPAVPARLLRAVLLGAKAGEEISFDQRDDGISVQMPHIRPDAAAVIRLEFDEAW